jgi:hypothetical protein
VLSHHLIELRQILTENEHVEILVRPVLPVDQGIHAPPIDYPAPDSATDDAR